MKNMIDLLGVNIGTTVSTLEGFSGAKVINGKITQLSAYREEIRSMTGHSRYARTDLMNQGSLGVAGSYGVSGISKLKASVNAYAGNAMAEGGKSMDVQYNVIVFTGVEYVKFNDLRVGDLLAALDNNTRQGALKALDAYLALEAQLTAEPCTIDAVLDNKEGHQKAYALFGNWIRLTDDFNRDAAEGVVVAVMWGGIGTVTMSMSASNKSTMWQYGANATFSYSGIGRGISVAGAYDGSQSSGRGEVHVDCKGHALGACVAELVAEWSAQVENKTFNQLADVHVLEKVPPLTAKNAKSPTDPGFIDPKPEKSITDKIGQIKDLKGLEALAKAAAYEQKKKDDKNPNLTLEQFLKDAKKEADTRKLQNLEENVENNSLHVGDALKASEPMTPSDFTEAPADGERAAGEGTADFVPLGVWIANWADLFPWLATGYCHDVKNVAEAEETLRYRMMIQDFQTLSRIYYLAEHCDLVPVPSGDARQVADSFHAQCGNLLTSRGPDRMRSAFNGLTEPAKKIYRKWDDLQFLRNCELGLGVMRKGRSPQGEGFLNTNDSWVYFTQSCQFTPGPDAPYSAFASFVKVFPLIGLTGEYLYAFGPKNRMMIGFENTLKDECLYFARGRHQVKFMDWPLIFEANTREKILENKTEGIKLYPIPFRAAASGIEWKGESLSTNLASMKGLNQQLRDVNQELSTRNSWTFSSDAWSPDWSPDDYYSMRRIRTQYIGTVPERHSPFK